MAEFRVKYPEHMKRHEGFRNKWHELSGKFSEYEWRHGEAAKEERDKLELEEKHFYDTVEKGILYLKNVSI